MERSRVGALGLLHPNDMDKRAIAEMTIGELEELIKRAVKDSVAEVMLDFAMEADVEASVVYEAEINDMLRAELQSYGGLYPKAALSRHNVDD